MLFGSMHSPQTCSLIPFLSAETPSKAASTNMFATLTWPVEALTIALLLVTATYLYINLYYKRFKQNAHLPHLPPSLLWGHLKTFDDFTKRGIRDRHPGKNFLYSCYLIYQLHSDLAK